MIYLIIFITYWTLSFMILSTIFFVKVNINWGMRYLGMTTDKNVNLGDKDFYISHIMLGIPATFAIFKFLYDLNFIHF